MNYVAFQFSYILQSRGQASKGGKAGTATTSAPKKDAGPSASSLLIHNDQKEQRNKKAKLKWAFDEPRPDYIEFLAEQFQPCAQDSLKAKLFSTDFKKHIEALNDLTTCAEQNKTETVENLDLILKWATLRLFDSNMAVLKKTIDYLAVLFNNLDAIDYHITDVEATNFLPFLVEKVGNNNETMRQSMRQLFRTLCKLYPASKLFRFIIEGLKSKNARTRTECLEELASLIERQGINVCSPKALPTIAERIFVNCAITRIHFFLKVYTSYQCITNYNIFR